MGVPRLTGCQPAARAASSSSLLHPPSGPIASLNAAGLGSLWLSSGRVGSPAWRVVASRAGPTTGVLNQAMASTGSARCGRHRRSHCSVASRTMVRQRSRGRAPRTTPRLASRGCSWVAPSSVAMRHTNSASRLGTAIARVIAGLRRLARSSG